MPNVLVVHYSRSGTTRAVAQGLAAALDADVEELRDHVDRTGALGYLRTGLEGIVGASTEIDRPAKDPARYDLVVVGSPVFAGAPSSPVRTYLWLERDHLPRVALFVTYGGAFAGRALGQMAAIAGKEPVATLAIREADATSAHRSATLAPFLRALRASLRAVPARRRRAAR